MGGPGCRQPAAGHALRPLHSAPSFKVFVIRDLSCHRPLDKKDINPRILEEGSMQSSSSPKRARTLRLSSASIGALSGPHSSTRLQKDPEKERQAAVGCRSQVSVWYTRQSDFMALPALSPSAVRRLVTRMDNGEKFVMQCIGRSEPSCGHQSLHVLCRDKLSSGLPVGVKQLAAQGNNPVPERFRLALSDGELWTSVMLATQLNHLVKDHLIENGSVIRLKDNLAQDMPNRRYPTSMFMHSSSQKISSLRHDALRQHCTELAIPV